MGGEVSREGVHGEHRAPERLVKISDLARMSGVPTATIKHYIREGLLPGPAKRTNRNMAYYDARLAARVRVIKELQKSRFLPLKVIAEVLEPAPSSALRSDLDAGQRRQLGVADAPGGPGSAESTELSDGGGAGPAAAAAAVPERAPRTREQVLASLRISAGDLVVLEDLGLIQRSDADGAAVYAGADLRILEVLDEARARGLGELFDLDVLPAYARAVSELVRMEIQTFGRRVSGGARMPNASLPEIARQATYLGERLLVAMREKLLVRALADVARRAPAAPDDDAASGEPGI